MALKKRQSSFVKLCIIVLIVYTWYLSIYDLVTLFTYNDDVIFVDSIEAMDEDFQQHLSKPIYDDFIQALKHAADDTNTVMMAPFDTGYMDMTLNFYVTSIAKHNITNMVFIGMDENSCSVLVRELQGARLTCVLMLHSIDASSSSSTAWGTNEFRDKTNLKRNHILKALTAGYNVLMTDVDTIYFGDPLPDVEWTCMVINCDLAIMRDRKHDNFNSGCIYARHTPTTILVYERQLQWDYDHTIKVRSDQQQLNVAIEQISREVAGGVVVAPLSVERYPVGKPFFFKRECPDPSAYDGVIILHHNYLRGKNNKNFRLKECQLWEYDGADGYYTNTTRKYLTYQYVRGNGEREHQGLLNAFTIGRILNRTVILPNTFYRDSGVKSNLMLRVYQKLEVDFIDKFNLYTENNYRESSFLQNKLVPQSVKNSRSPTYHIVSHDDITDTWRPYLQLLYPDDIIFGPSVSEILTWFGGKSASVLQLDSMYGNFLHLDYVAWLGQEFVELVSKVDGQLLFQKYITPNKVVLKKRKGKTLPENWV